ncbi:hypothetical protein PG990_009884 [Apiospora arundinis]|uniref:Uncharacterized protein n=1 Tax=Apiospora arundinis TaxID=335852 RepID=A0ABR2IU49_9PEZI
MNGEQSSRGRMIVKLRYNGQIHLRKKAPADVSSESFGDQSSTSDPNDSAESTIHVNTSNLIARRHKNDYILQSHSVNDDMDMAASGSEHNPIEVPSDDDMDIDKNDHVAKSPQSPVSKQATSIPKEEVEEDLPKAASSHNMKNYSDADWVSRLSLLIRDTGEMAQLLRGTGELEQMLLEEKQLRIEAENKLSATEQHLCDAQGALGEAKLRAGELKDELAQCRQHSVTQENDWNLERAAMEAGIKKAKEKRDGAMHKLDALGREKSVVWIRQRRAYQEKADEVTKLQREFAAQKQQLEGAVETNDALQELLDEERETSKARQRTIDQRDAELKQFTELAAKLAPDKFAKRG